MCSAGYQEHFYKIAAEIVLDGVVFQLQEAKDKSHNSYFRFGKYVIYAGNNNYEDNDKGRTKFALIARFILGNVSKTFEITKLDMSKGETRPLILEKLSEYFKWQCQRFNVREYRSELEVKYRKRKIRN